MAALGGTPGVIIADCEGVQELAIGDGWSELVIATDGVWDVLPVGLMPQVSLSSDTPLPARPMPHRRVRAPDAIFTGSSSKRSSMLDQFVVVPVWRHRLCRCFSQDVHQHGHKFFIAMLLGYFANLWYIPPTTDIAIEPTSDRRLTRELIGVTEICGRNGSVRLERSLDP